MKYIIIVILVIIMLVTYFKYIKVEHFDIPLINPYSLYLHQDITQREDTWNLAHAKKLYYYDNVVPYRFKDYQNFSM